MSVNEDDIKEVAQKCYEKISSKAIEIFLIVLTSLLLAMYIACFSIINMNAYGGYGALYFFILAPLVINLAFSIVLRVWRSKGVIKKEKKKRGTNIALTGFIFSAITYGFAMITDKIISNDSEELAKKCLTKIENCPHYYDSLVLNITFILTNIISMFLLYAWLYLRERIKAELDEPPSSRNIGTQTTNEPEKEETIPFVTTENRQGSDAFI